VQPSHSLDIRSLARVAPWLLLFAFALRIANLDAESLWRDEVDAVRFALQPIETLLARFTETGFNGPLYHILLRGWFALVGVSDFALRYFSLMAGVVLVALIYVLGRRLFGELAGWLAAWLAALSPALVWYAGEGKMYTLQPALLTLALYALLRAIGKGGQTATLPTRTPLVWWATFVVATSLSFYVQLLSPLFLAVAASFFLAAWPAARHALRPGATALALLTLPYLPLLAWQAPILIQGGDIGHAFYPLDQIAWGLMVIWSFGLDPHAPLWPGVSPVTLLTVRLAWVAVAVIVVSAGLASIASRIPQRAQSLRWALALLAWLALPSLLLFLVSLRLPLFQPRYVLWSAPALYLLLAMGLAHLLTQRPLAGWLTVGAASMVALSGVAAQWLHPIRPDLRGAIACLLQRAQPGDAIAFQIPYARHSFAYYAAQMGYASAEFRLIEAPYTNRGMSYDELAAIMSALTSEAQRVWLFETEAAMWDSRRMVRHWFDASLALVERCEGRAVEVGLYRPK